jgi:hypothetical protein
MLAVVVGLFSVIDALQQSLVIVTFSLSFEEMQFSNNNEKCSVTRIQTKRCPVRYDIRCFL